MISRILPLLLLHLFANTCKSQLKPGKFSAIIDGLKITYTVKGNGPVMMAGHLNSGAIGYQLTLEPMEKYFTMVYYNPRGTADSDAPATIREYEFEYLVREVDGLRKILNVEKVWLFGHSDQSTIALHYAIEYPSHVGGLILSGTRYLQSLTQDLTSLREFEEKRKRESEWFKQVCRDLDFSQQYNTETDSSGRDLSFARIKWWCYNEESAKKVIPIVKEIDRAGRRKAINGHHVYATFEERERATEQAKKYQNFYHSIAVPVLIVNGAYDTANPPNAASRLGRLIKTSSVYLVPKAAHFPWVEQPAAFFYYFKTWYQAQRREANNYGSALYVRERNVNPSQLQTNPEFLYNNLYKSTGLLTFAS